MESMYHKHHIIPKHMGGSNDPSNIVELTIEEHAEAHRLLWEEHGNIYDKVAWLSLSRQITPTEAERMAKAEGVSRFHSGRKRSEETRERMRVAQRKSVEEGRHRTGHSGYNWPEESRKAFSDNLTGKKRGAYKKSPCPKCGMMVSGNMMARWHGDKCIH